MATPNDDHVDSQKIKLLQWLMSPTALCLPAAILCCRGSKNIFLWPIKLKESLHKRTKFGVIISGRQQNAFQTVLMDRSSVDIDPCCIGQLQRYYMLPNVGWWLVAYWTTGTSLYIETKVQLTSVRGQVSVSLSHTHNSIVYTGIQGDIYSAWALYISISSQVYISRLEG